MRAQSSTLPKCSGFVFRLGRGHAGLQPRILQHSAIGLRQCTLCVPIPCAQLPGKVQHVLCTGNLCSKDQLEWLKTLAPHVVVTKGDFDDDSTLRETEVVTIGDFRIGVCHGHTVIPWGDAEALASLARRLECDILVTGHTHAATVVEIGGRIIVNPGSMTGAYSAPTETAAVESVCRPGLSLM